MADIVVYRITEYKSSILWFKHGGIYNSKVTYNKAITFKTNLDSCLEPKIRLGVYIKCCL